MKRATINNLCLEIVVFDEFHLTIKNKNIAR